MKFCCSPYRSSTNIHNSFLKLSGSYHKVKHQAPVLLLLRHSNAEVNALSKQRWRYICLPAYGVRRRILRSSKSQRKHRLPEANRKDHLCCVTHKNICWTKCFLGNVRHALEFAEFPVKLAFDLGLDYILQSNVP